jgi:hypothetical protein
MDFWSWLLSVLGVIGTFALSLAVPAIRSAIGKYVAKFVDHHFDERLEKLKSELRQSEQRFAAELKAKDQQLQSLANTALSLRSTRQAALDVRRLAAAEALWKAKVATDRLKPLAQSVSLLNLKQLFKAAEAGDKNIPTFAVRSSRCWRRVSLCRGLLLRGLQVRDRA